MIAITESDNSNAGFVIMVVYTCFVSVASREKIKDTQIPIFGVPPIEGDEDVYYYKRLPALTITDEIVEHSAFLGVLLPKRVRTHLAVLHSVALWLFATTVRNRVCACVVCSAKPLIRRYASLRREYHDTAIDNMGQFYLFGTRGPCEPHCYTVLHHVVF